MQTRGFTIIEVAVATGTLCVAGALLQPVASGVGAPSKRFKDADQLRQILAAHMIWAGANDGAYPLPGDIDVLGTTVDVGQEHDPERRVQLNNTSNTFSVLIFNRLVAPETFVSPAETNFQVLPYLDYEYVNPSNAPDEKNAFWDPAFHATPLARYNLRGADGSNPIDIGNNSYAQNPALGMREPLWGLTANPDHVVLGNRGPIYEGNAYDGWELADGLGGNESNSIFFYTDAAAWQGNIAYNDGRVELETSAAPADLLWTFPELPPRLQVQPDNMFQNEDKTGDERSESASAQGESSQDGHHFYQAQSSDVNAYLRPIADVTGTTDALGNVATWID